MKIYFMWYLSRGSGFRCPRTFQYARCATRPINFAVFGLIISSNAFLIFDSSKFGLAVTRARLALGSLAARLIPPWSLSPSLLGLRSFFRGLSLEGELLS